MYKKIGVLTIAVLTILMAACSSSPEHKGVYENSVDDRPLEVPPDLTAPDTNTELRAPQLASKQGNVDLRGGNKIAPLQIEKARLVRESSLRWMEVAMPVDEVWQQAALFFRGLGFKLTREDQSLGVIETDWLENRANVPTNWISSLLKKLYSSGLQDRYRIRLERALDNKHTLVFIAHRGLKEIVREDDPSHAETKGWVAREPDAELETEMLQRFALHLGGAKNDLQQQAASSEQQADFATVLVQDGITSLRLNEGFARGWRRVGLALDRMGVQIEDRNRSKGTYFLRFPEGVLKEEEEGLFAKLFASKEELTQTQYQLRLIGTENQTMAAIFDGKGQPISNKLADHILNQIKSHLI